MSDNPFDGNPGLWERYYMGVPVWDNDDYPADVDGVPIDEYEDVEEPIDPDPQPPQCKACGQRECHCDTATVAELTHQPWPVAPEYPEPVRPGTQDFVDRLTEWDHYARGD